MVGRPFHKHSSNRNKTSPRCRDSEGSYAEHKASGERLLFQREGMSFEMLMHVSLGSLEMIPVPSACEADVIPLHREALGMNPLEAGAEGEGLAPGAGIPAAPGGRQEANSNGEELSPGVVVPNATEADEQTEEQE
eukprot:3321818-Amphidinium_carterae.1